MEASLSPNLRAASLLLEAGCVTVRSDEPFRLPSGWASPVYIDCRRLIALPSVRRELVRMFLSKLEDAGVSAAIDGVAACETSGIPFGSWLAEHLDLPLHIVRKALRGERQVEGAAATGQRLLLVDDVMAAGTSKFNFLNALESTGAEVSDLLVIFNYTTFRAEEQLWKRGVRTHALANWEDVRVVAEERGLFDAHSLKELADFLANPADWSHRNGGRGI